MSSHGGKLAQALHEQYVHERLAAGEALGTRTSLVSWEELPEEFRASSLRNADDLCEAFRARGYELTERPLAEAAVRVPEAEVESIARWLHERWLAERETNGWRYGEQRDDGAKLHPDLVPWVELADERREIDRNFVRGFPELVRRVGLELVRAH